MGTIPKTTLVASLMATGLATSALAAAPASAAGVPAICNGLRVTKYVESGEYRGSLGNDVVVVTGPATLRLSEGNDSVCVHADNARINVYLDHGSDTLLTFGNAGEMWAYGADGDDTIQGGAGRNFIFGGEGHDTLSATGANTTIYGGAGNDTIIGGTSSDRLYGEAGHDRIEGGKGDDVIGGGAGDDTLLGGDGHDQLFGNDGKDRIEGGKGNDTIAGGDGFDVLDGSAGDDHIVGGLDRDTIYGGPGDDSLWGGLAEHEGEDLSWITNREAARTYTLRHVGDWIYGQDGNDKIVGGLGGDWLDGGTGDDYIEGGPGEDLLLSGHDIKKSGSWQQVTGDTLIGDYYETRTNGGFSWDRDILLSSPGADGDDNQRPGIVKHAYGGAGDDVIAVLGISSLSRVDGKDTIKRTDPSKAHGGVGDDQIIALYMEKVEAQAGKDTIWTVDVPEIFAGSGNDDIRPYKWEHAYGGDGADTFDLCQSPSSKHGYSWGEGGVDKWIGSTTVFNGVDPKDTPPLDGYTSYENARAAAIPSRYTFTTIKSGGCPSGHDAAKVKVKNVQDFFADMKAWVDGPRWSSGLPQPWK